MVRPPLKVRNTQWIAVDGLEQIPRRAPGLGLLKLLKPSACAAPKKLHTHTHTQSCPRKACGRVLAHPRLCRFLLIHFPDERHAGRTATSCDEWQPKRGACVPSEEHHFTCWAPAVIQQHTHLLAVLAMLAEFSAVPSCGKSWVGARKRIPHKGSSSSDTWLLASATQVNIPAGRRQRRHCHELQRKHARPRARLDRGAAGLVGRLVYLVSESGYDSQ